jgi:hypothetical protein
MTLAALGLTEAPVHEPVHDHHSERLMSTTERYHAPREIRRLVRLPGVSQSVFRGAQILWFWRRLAGAGGLVLPARASRGQLSGPDRPAFVV